MFPLQRTGASLKLRVHEDSVLERSRWLLIGLLLCSAVAVVVIGFRYYFLPQDPQTAVMGMPHQNHRPQHGGQFFMAEDNIHHLEGVLIAPGTLRIYVYDAYTVALPPEGVLETTGTVELGESGKEIPLQVSPDGKTLQMDVVPRVRFPIELTARIHLPGEAPDRKPELFTFDFKRFTEVTN